MKKLKKLLLASLITCTLPINVFAETFIDGDKTYDLKERVVPCVENLDYETTLKDGTMVYINYDAKNAEEAFVKLTTDNKCLSVTKTEDILNLAKELDYNFYEIWFEYVTPGEEGIYKTIDRSNYIRDGLKKATTYVSGKEYYTYDDINNNYNSVGEIDEATFNSGEYYETVYFKLPDSVEIKKGVDYYTSNNFITFTKVEEVDLSADKILQYYIITDEEWIETVKIKDVSDKLLKVLKEKAYKNHQTITSITEKEFYILGYLDDSFETFDVLDEEGNIIFEKVSWFTTILDELYAVSKDDKTYIYNKNMEVIYTAGEDLLLEELGFSNNISSLDGNNKKLYQLTKTIKQEETKEPEKETTPSITNPETSDNIMSTMIITIVTGLGLGSLILFQRKQKNN